MEESIRTLVHSLVRVGCIGNGVLTGEPSKAVGNDNVMSV
jgi:hypothetical protein